MTTSLSTSPYGANRAQRRAALAQNKQRLTKRGGRQRQQWLNRPSKLDRVVRGHQKLARWFGF